MIESLSDLSKKTKFGFYRVGDREFINKISAIQHDNRTKSGIRWIFNDEAFSNHDWTREPEQSLEELYRQRALDIRSSYDYVVLWYSGGADSHNVLSSFIKHGIHVDEIAVNTYQAAEGGRTSYWTQEVDATALPDIQLLRLQLPHTKIRYIDFTAYLDKIYQGDLRWDWIYQQNSSLSPNNFLRSWIRELDPHYKSIIDSGKKMVFVWGSDKPRITYENGRLGLYFQDLVDTCVSTRTTIQDRSWEHDELFYWSPNSVSMLIKQAHCLKKFLTDTPLPNSYLVAEHNMQPYHNRDLGTIVRDGVRYYLSRAGQSTVIYPWWPQDRWQQPKAISLVMSPRDSWFFADNHNDTVSLARSAFFNALDKIPQLIGTHWLNKELQKPNWYWYDTDLLTRFRASAGLVGCKSQVYWIDPEVDQ